MMRILYLHKMFDNPKEGNLKKIVNHLTNQGHHVTCPHFPLEVYGSSVSDRLKYIKLNFFNNHFDYVIGHSIGSSVAIDLGCSHRITNMLAVHNLILITPFFTNFVNVNPIWLKINKVKTTILYEENDPVVPFMPYKDEIEKRFNLAEAYLKLIKLESSDHGEHFNPSILESLINPA